MKHNLKNRPETHDVYCKDQTYTHYPDEWEFNEWFEGFQKELKLHYRTWSPQLPGEELVNMLIKEILGE